jgi:hypothetical protein
MISNRRKSAPDPHAVLVLAALAAALAAGAANAQAVSPIPVAPAASPAGASARSSIDLSVSRTDLEIATAQANALRAAGVVQTAVDHSFAPHDDVVGSLGFLCGRQPAYSHSGVAEARGYDPDGKFLGGKLSFAF